MLPSVCGFLTENSLVFIIKLIDVVNMMWILCDQSTLDEVFLDIVEIEFGCEFLNVAEKLILWNPNEGILDPVICQ